VEKLQAVSEIIGYICLIATIVVKLTPSKKDDTIVGKVCGLVHKVMKMFPTLGVNPSTELLEQKLSQVEMVKKS